MIIKEEFYKEIDRRKQANCCNERSCGKSYALANVYLKIPDAENMSAEDQCDLLLTKNARDFIYTKEIVTSFIVTSGFGYWESCGCFIFDDFAKKGAP